jgi:hypothetical protein
VTEFRYNKKNFQSVPVVFISTWREQQAKSFAKMPSKTPAATVAVKYETLCRHIGI